MKAHFYTERLEIDIQNTVIEQFLEEIVIMKQFNHPNVLSLIGISVHNNKPCALLPYMSNRDMKTFLQKNQMASIPMIVYIFN